MRIPIAVSNAVSAIAAVAMAAAPLTGCREAPVADSPVDREGTPASEARAPMCAEHGVPESACTKCHPELIASFKAKGDWCAEHEFPESVCPICNPSRPAAAVTASSGHGASGSPAARGAHGGGADAGVGHAPHDESAPADGLKVMLRSFDTARQAGIRTVPAVEGPADAALSVNARIAYDASKVARVNARASGVIVSLAADIGTKVRRGAPLVTIESAGVGADQSRLQAARSHVRVSEANLGRVTRLHAEGIVPEVDVLDARKDADEARAELDSAQAALGMVGGTAEGGSRYTLASPLTGVVTVREATLGRMVDTEDTLFTIVDVSTVWAEVEIPETELADIDAGAPVTLVVEGLPDRTFSGGLTYVSPEIDPRTRTAVGRIELANADGALRVHMFGSARIARTAGRTRVLVPREAVQNARGVRLVFVRLSEQVYEARRVAAEETDGGLVAVSGRLKPGDAVVTEGSFLLKTETLSGSIGAGCCEPGGGH